MSKLTVVERLNEQLSEAEQKNIELEEKLENIKYQDNWKWRHIHQLTEEENLGLPIPRMELRYRVDAYNAYADYGLVIRHLMKNIDFIPINSTRVNISYAAKLELPFRDGAHLIHDKENLKIPAYVVYKDTFREITFKDPKDRTNA